MQLVNAFLLFLSLLTSTLKAQEQMDLFAQIIEHDEGIGLWWAGHNGWIIKHDGLVISTDLLLNYDKRIESPPIAEEDLAKVLDISFVTHGHKDHFARSISKTLIEKSKCIFVIPESCLEIARGKTGIHKEAALYSFNQFGKALGFVLADILNLIDGLIVIGGGISTAWDLFAPAMFGAIQRKHQMSNGNTVNRTTIQVFNIENEQEKQSFLKGAMSEV